MLTSMTGFGRAEVSLPSAGQAVVEIHTLNHRFLEVECRLAEGLQSFEEEIRAMAAGAIRRGRVKVSMTLRTGGVRAGAVFQADVARYYVTQLKRLKQQLGIPGSVTLETVLTLPQVVAAPERDLLRAQGWPALRRGVAQALAQVVRMKRKEGRHLGREMDRLARALETLAAKIRRRLPALRAGFEKRLAARIKALAPTADPKAMAAEAASIVQAGDVTEELARIDSHLVHLRRAVGGRVESPGRTIDFLAQELHREVNTLGTKARQPQVVWWGVAMKNQIEKLREQAANVE